MSTQIKNILIVAGDVSGDIHAGNLIRALKELDADLHITTIGGQNMKREGDTFLLDLASKGASGFVEPLKKMPLWIHLLKQINQYMLEKHPVAVITVDFYGFNHQVLKLAKKHHIPAYYYVTPQVWASRQYRAKNLAKLTKKMYVIYPFEPAFHKERGGNAAFLGNPLLDILPEATAKTYTVGCPQTHNWKLGLLPGSRPGEIKRLAPVFYQAFLQILKFFPNTQAYMFLLPDANETAFREIIGEPLHPNFHFIKDTNYQTRSQMDYLLACSGTATLENALLGVPMLVAYQLSWITYHIAKLIIQVKYISLVNILANQEIVKEFIQEKATSTSLANETIDMFNHPTKLQHMHTQLLTLRAQLGKPGVAKRVAMDILKDL